MRQSLLLWTLVAACTSHKPPMEPGTPQEIAQGFAVRGAKVQAQDAYGDHAEKVMYLDQGWGPTESLWYYYADQGSAFMPYEMFVHLEQAATEQLLIHEDFLAKFRFLNQHATPNNPDALPIGFARHQDQVGLTCAACHTGQINYQGTAIRIDGAPAHADIIGFFHAIEASLSATLSDEAKFKRYATTAFGGQGDPQQLRTALQGSLDWFHSYNTVNTSSTPEGFARLDAIGRIINQAIRFSSGPEHSISPNAPASLPLLWDAPRHDFVQWTGFVPNAGPGALGRNVGEVVGVYAQVEMKHYTTEEEAKKGYASSIEANTLVSLEESLRGLQSPQWPEEVLGKIEQKQAERGAVIYDENCVSCHAHIDRADPKRKVTAMMIGIDQVGTDATSADNLISARVPAGILEGAVSTDGGFYGAEIPALLLLKDLDVRILSTHPEAVVRAVAAEKLAGVEESEKQGNYPKATEANPMAPLRSYKARPLNGVWASSPYLHNGSVPNLYALLLPPDQRPSQFSVGRWEYDPKYVWLCK